MMASSQVNLYDLRFLIQVRASRKHAGPWNCRHQGPSLQIFRTLLYRRVVLVLHPNIRIPQKRSAQNQQSQPRHTQNHNNQTRRRHFQFGIQLLEVSLAELPWGRRIIQNLGCAIPAQHLHIQQGRLFSQCEWIKGHIRSARKSYLLLGQNPSMILILS